MDKSNKKRLSYNSLVIDQLHKKYGYSKNYIRECINGTRKTQTADLLKKDYQELNNKIQAALSD